MQAGESHSFSSVQWGLPVAASFTLGAKGGEVPTFPVSIPFAIKSKINFWLKGAKSSQEVYSVGSAGGPVLFSRAYTFVSAARRKAPDNDQINERNASPDKGKQRGDICFYFLGSSRRDAELMQKRMPVGCGPSGNTWPRCAPHFRQFVSVRVMP